MPSPNHQDARRDLDQLRADTLDCFDRLLADFTNELSATLLASARAARDRLTAGQYRVIVCGEFRRGKSSLLNALVQRPRLFPVELNITTAAVMTLSWSATERVTVHLVDESQPSGTRRVEAKSVGEIRDYVTEQGNPGNGKEVVLVEVGMPIEELRGGLVLVDTPGIGSVNAAHTAATNAHLDLADALVFVASATEPLSEYELRFFARAAARCRTVAVAVTKSDQAIDIDAMVAEVRARITKATGVAAASLFVQPVSALRLEMAVARGDDKRRAESGFPALGDYLWHNLSITCGVEQGIAALDVMEDMVRVARLRHATAYDAVHHSDPLAELKRQINKVKADIAAAKNTETARRALKDAITQADRDVQKALADEFERISGDFNNGLNATAFDPDGLVQKVSTAAVAVTEQSTKDLTTALDKIADKHLRTPQTTGKPGETIQLGQIDLPDQVYATEVSNFTRFRTRLAGANAYGAAGAVAGGVVGSVVPIIGTAVGAAFGALVGQVTGLFLGHQEGIERNAEKLRRQQMARIGEHVNKRIDSARRRAEQGLRYQAQDAKDSLLRAFDDQAKAHQETLAKTEQKLRDTLNAAADRLAEERARTAAALEAFAVRHEEVDRLRTRAEALSGNRP
ncbi:dynamin family protein [Actinokineospora inagensis]|uniref:dynamin family protein n=1 Tax=Actinokineospora inagensis TaxID=103730 RepID=UPI00040A8371|nr:dynamin family protein [Actinokineospora inagensis]